MTNGTSSSSANGTTEAPKPDRTGRPHIANISGTTSAIEEFLTKFGPQGETAMGLWEYRWWNAKVHLRHIFGVHTLIAVEDWTRMPDGNVKIEKNGMKCWKCEYREP